MKTERPAVKQPESIEKEPKKFRYSLFDRFNHLNFRKMIIIIYAAVVVAIVLLALWFSFRDADHHKHPA